jgi:hypothetical protein
MTKTPSSLARKFVIISCLNLPENVFKVLFYNNATETFVNAVPLNAFSVNQQGSTVAIATTFRYNII